MTIKHVQNPVTNENLTIVEGEVEGVYFKEIDGGADKYGNTHRGSVKIDGDYVNNINLKVKEGYDPEIRFNAGSRAAPDWQSVHVGDVLKLVVTENEYNGKTYYNGKVSQIVLVSKGAGVAKHASSAQGGPTKKSYTAKKDNSPIVAGNARTAANNFLRAQNIDLNEDVFAETVKKFVAYSDRKRKEYAAAHTDLDEFEVGVSVGQAVVLASLWADLGDWEQLDGDVDLFLAAVPASIEAVKALSSSKEAAKEQKEEKKEAPKAATKTTTRKPRAKPAPEPDVDEDLPF